MDFSILVIDGYLETHLCLKENQRRLKKIQLHYNFFIAKTRYMYTEQNIHHMLVHLDTELETKTIKKKKIKHDTLIFFSSYAAPHFLHLRNLPFFLAITNKKIDKHVSSLFI